VKAGAAAGGFPFGIWRRKASSLGRHRQDDAGPDQEPLPEGPEVGGGRRRHPGLVALRPDGEWVRPEEAGPQVAPGGGDHVVVHLAQPRQLGLPLGLERLGVEGRREDGVGQEAEGAVRVRRQHLGREAERVVPGVGAEGAADLLDPLGDRGGGAPAGVLGQEGGEEGAAAPPAGGLAERAAMGQEAEVQVRQAPVRLQEQPGAVLQADLLEVGAGDGGLGRRDDGGRHRLGFQRHGGEPAGREEGPDGLRQVGRGDVGQPLKVGAAEVQVPDHDLGDAHPRRLAAHRLAGVDLGHDRLAEGLLHLGGGEAARGRLGPQDGEDRGLGGGALAGVADEGDAEEPA
jgi:hypothetical protein